MRLLPALFILLLFCTCSPSPHTATAEDSTAIILPSIPHANWVNVNYVACIDTSCPCECWRSSIQEKEMAADAVSMITLDSVNGALRASIYTHSMDCDSWILTRDADGNFEGWRSGQLIGMLIPAGDQLLLAQHGDTAAFRSYPELETRRGSEYIYTLNAYLLNSTLADSDTLLRSLFALDSTIVSCSPEMGNVLIAPKLPVHKEWILYPRNGNIALYQYTGDGNRKHEIPAADTLYAGLFPRK